MPRTITLSDVSYDRIVEELTNVKDTLEFSADEEGIDLDDKDQCEEFDAYDEWKEICDALKELGA